MFSLLFAFSLISFCAAQPANADTLKNKELELDQTEKRIEKIENNLAKMQIYTHNHAFLTHGQYNFYIIFDDFFKQEEKELKEEIKQQKVKRRCILKKISKIKRQQKIVKRAISKIGCPYSWGGCSSLGFDCSGFVSYCLTGKENTRIGTTADFINWPIAKNPAPGDICVVHNGAHQHTGVYIGNGFMIHASGYGVGVIKSKVGSDMIIVKSII